MTQTSVICHFEIMILEISLAYLLKVRVALLSRKRSQSKSLLLTETLSCSRSMSRVCSLFGALSNLPGSSSPSPSTGYAEEL